MLSIVDGQKFRAVNKQSVKPICCISEVFCLFFYLSLAAALCIYASCCKLDLGLVPK